MIKDVAEASFQSDVIERSSEVPVVVDFWAEWCGPCRQLSPALESAVQSRKGDVELAKVDVDSNQALAAEYRVQGIPAVKAFKDGQVVEEFTGAIPPAQVEAFLNTIVPSEADRLADGGDEAALRQALELDHRVDQFQTGDLKFAAQQRAEREIQVERLEARHVGGGRAGNVGEPHIRDRKPGRRQQGDLHVAIDPQLASGQRLDAFRHVGLVAVPIDEHRRDQRRHDDQDQEGD